jgi:hypothetical protein
MVRRGEQAVLFNDATGLKYPLPPMERRIDLGQEIDFAGLCDWCRFPRQ